MPSNPKILIIDDEVEICLNIKEMFQFEGYDADYAITAKEGMQKLESNPYQLLLVDIKLGGPVTGIEIIKTLREKPQKPKIIVISAIPRDALDAIFIKEGISELIVGFLNKPSCCNPDKLLGLAKKFLDKI